MGRCFFDTADYAGPTVDSHLEADLKLSEEISDAVAADWNTHFTSKLVLAELKISTVVTRTGRKKPGYELINLKPLNEPPSALPAPATPPEPPATRVKRKSNFGEE
ncbi:MAG: hypothetical protein WCS94_12225 [Verrucomicrobiota bacterium]